ncbi:helix-turn-helix domain-containing protein [Altererythrobacter lutimaris]|uniref:MarR family transcriptional regulator n=1 Tax=Altererythrobacter lutimaris TaxID=2743979 RepID=A0A850H684_9SPHN|nr:MarR family transcriptional regulator [Altererythrobacter lutimaris]NVE94657.1 MarR family transcriptional regulator [Altererythrobacter lutimaris]
MPATAAENDFSYDAPADGAGLPARISVFADAGSKRDELRGELSLAGFRPGLSEPVSALLEGQTLALGDAVVLACPQVDAAMMAALSRLDMRIARSGTPLIVLTSMGALNDVFACFEQSAPQILVESGHAELTLALGRILSVVSGRRVRELTETEQMTLLRLTEQVEAIARKIDGFAESGPGTEPETTLANLSKPRFEVVDNDAASTAALKLPDAAVVRKIIQHRQARARFFDSELFADPAWDMLLDLTAAHSEGQQVCVSSLCIAAGVPATTALRWIRQMVDQGIFTRVEDENDKRRAFIALSENSRQGMARYFAAIEEPLALAA